MSPEYATGFCFGLLLANLLVIWLSLKLYTEIFKARDQDRGR